MFTFCFICSSSRKSRPEDSCLGQAEINSRDVLERGNIQETTNPSKAIILPVCGVGAILLFAIRCDGLQKKLAVVSQRVQGVFPGFVGEFRVFFPALVTVVSKA